MNAGKKICWSEIAKELNRRDDACLRRWKIIAPLEQQVAQKTLQIKYRECIRPNYVDISSRRRASLKMAVSCTDGQNSCLSGSC